jgi:hypothetical protein
MANIRFTPGLLSQISEFGQNLAGPQTRSGQGLLTGAQQPVANLGQTFARNLGGLFGRDMRTTEEKAQAELRSIDPKDPDAQIKGLEVIAKYGTPSQIQAAIAKRQEIQAKRLAAAEKLAEEQAEVKRVEDKRSALVALSVKLGLDMGPQIQSAAPDELSEIGKELINRQIELSTRGDDAKAVVALAATAGITPAELKAQYGEDLPTFEEMKTIVERGDKGAIKAYVPIGGGGARMYSVLGDKVLIDGKWVRASDAGLAPAPQRVQQEQIDGIFGRMPKGAKDLVNESISNTIKDGQDAEEILRTNEESQRLLDTGEMYTGLTANVALTFGQIGSIFGFDATSAEVTEQFTLQRFGRVADIIQAYGAGTGLSDADRDFALAQAGKATLQYGTLVRLLELERKYATLARDNKNNLIDYLTENEYLTPEAAGIFEFTRKTPVSETSVINWKDM